MATTETAQKKWLLRRFHTLCTRNGLSIDQKAALIGSYGVESSKDMTGEQLSEACRLLDEAADPQAARMDRLRRRAMAAIGGWLKIIGQEADAAYIKGVTCRAAGVEHFNRITAGSLTTIYNMFRRKQLDARRVDAVAGAIAYNVRFGGQTTNPN